MVRVRVLLAEDHPLVAKVLEQLLQREFDVVGVVSDGQALIDAAAAHVADVIVSDFLMPRVDGLQALEQIQKQGPNVKLILVTMDDEATLVRRALRAGVSGVVLKNFASTDLAVAIRAALNGGTFLSVALASKTSQS